MEDRKDGEGVFSPSRYYFWDLPEIHLIGWEKEVMPHRSDYSPDPMGFAISWAGLLLLLLILKVIEGGME